MSGCPASFRRSLDQSRLEDTLYTIFLEIMNETMAANLDTTTPIVPRRPESIEEIISFIKDVTNNTETFRSQTTKELTDDDLSKVTNIPFSVTEKIPDDTPTILYPETTTTGENITEVNINRRHFILPIILPFATGCAPSRRGEVSLDHGSGHQRLYHRHCSAAGGRKVPLRSQDWHSCWQRKEKELEFFLHFSFLCFESFQFVIIT